MNYNERKGFTLIELLAVIVILAIIALIATPLIMNVIDDSKKGSFKSTAYGIVKSAELEYASNILKGINGEVTYTYEDGTENASVGGNLQYKGTKPKSGEVKIDKKGKIALAIHDGTYCAKKDYNEDTVTITKTNASQCNLLPEGYDLIESSDFEYIIDEYAPNAYENGVNGYYHYIGTAEYVVIPTTINGNQLKDYYSMFYNTMVKGVVSNNPKITDMSLMFYDNEATELDVSRLDTSNVTNMSGMFEKVKATKLDLSNFDTSKVTDMSKMFYVSQVDEIIFGDNFDTSNVTDMSWMFGCPTSKVDFNVLNTSKVTDMSGMFYYNKTTTLDLSNFDTSNVTAMTYMFYKSEATTINLSSFNTSKVTEMANMFGWVKATALDLSNFDTSNVTNMFSMFYVSKMTTLDLSNFDTSNVTNMYSMFANSAATEIIFGDNFVTNNVTEMRRMFESCKVTSLDLSNFNTSNVIYVTDMFRACEATVGYARTQADANKFNSSSNKPSSLTFVVKA